MFSGITLFYVATARYQGHKSMLASCWLHPGMPQNFTHMPKIFGVTSTKCTLGARPQASNRSITVLSHLMHTFKSEEIIANTDRSKEITDNIRARKFKQSHEWWTWFLDMLNSTQISWTEPNLNPCNPALYFETTAFNLLCRTFLSN